jgi:DNA-binding CsgD family transcriptional regulator
MRAIEQCGSGLCIVKDRVDFVSKIAAGRFSEAVGGAARLKAGDLPSRASYDFPVPRAHGKPPLFLSIRPLPRGQTDGMLAAAVAIAFVHDPAVRNAAGRLLREMYGLTDAEVGVAQALRAGMSPGQYARERAVSLNTVYTHLRRIKDKTGCRRLPELIRKLNDAHISLRDN